MAVTIAQVAPPARLGRRRVTWTWLGLVPFFVFATLFLLVPTFYLVVGSFQDKAVSRRSRTTSTSVHRRSATPSCPASRSASSQRCSAGSSASCSRTPSSAAGCHDRSGQDS